MSSTSLTSVYDDDFRFAHYHTGLSGSSTIVATFALRRVGESAAVEDVDQISVTLFGMQDSNDDPVVGTLYLSRARIHGRIRDLQEGSLFVVSTSFHIPVSLNGVVKGVMGEHFYGIVFWMVPAHFPDRNFMFKPFMNISGRVQTTNAERRKSLVFVAPKLCYLDPAISRASLSRCAVSAFHCKYPDPSRPLIPSDDKMAESGDCVAVHGILTRVQMHASTPGRVKYFEVNVQCYSVAEVQAPPGFEMIRRPEMEIDT